ncbi:MULTISPECIES: GNAT family N-acetyltransferase [unclassified Sphingobacterium]|uniref:GNAT family N-acetyltransferase n=1 Tax=unclassified Sphingobacterium TaxID=2609468 RepID=UPI0025FF565A|nr:MULTISPECIES: GNAT family N-acetyltransferase [unclassified Sphingobacterium]
MTKWYIEQVFAARTWKLRKEVFSSKGQLAEVMLDEDFEASHFAAYHENDVVGILTLRRSDDDYEILYFAVHPDFRMQGIGCALLRHARQFVKTFDGHCLFIRTSLQDHYFWTHNGFVLVEEFDRIGRFTYNLEEDIISQ